jgi:AraC-like DNA-binding protein
MSPPATLLEAWQHHCTASSSSLVVPDGCRDLIAVETAGQPARWFVSHLADAGYAVKSIAGQTFTGYRLQPGTRIAEQALLDQMHTVEPVDELQALSWLEEFTQPDADTQDALLALARASSVAGAARSLGVQERSLERRVLRNTGRTPVYWRRLARLRRAARAVCSARSLAEVAADQGFSD